VYAGAGLAFRRMRTIEADYPVVGAGGMGTAFIDTLVTETSATRRAWRWWTATASRVGTGPRPTRSCGCISPRCSTASTRCLSVRDRILSMAKSALSATATKLDQLMVDEALV